MSMQEGSYEKTGYLKEDFRLFHLKDSREQTFAYHYHDFDKILIFLSGRGSYRIEGRSYALAPCDIVFVRHGSIHKPEVDFSVPYERIIAYLSPDFLRSAPMGSDNLNLCFEKMQAGGSDVFRPSPAADERLLQSIFVLAGASSDSGYGHELYTHLLFLEFMVWLNRSILDERAVYPKAAEGNPKILEILRYINSNLKEDLSVDLLASRFYFSRSYLMRTFKKETGCTLAGYIQEKRLLMAREQIRLGAPATQAALDCGFRDYSAFAKAFKQKFSASPVHFSPGKG